MCRLHTANVQGLHAPWLRSQTKSTMTAPIKASVKPQSGPHPIADIFGCRAR